MNQPKKKTEKQPINNYRTSGKVEENHPNAKLTTKQVQQIRALGSQGITIVALSERFKMSKSAITSILSRNTWKNIPDVETPSETAS